jgi:hypothetical protein
MKSFLMRQESPASVLPFLCDSSTDLNAAQSQLRHVNWVRLLNLVVAPSLFIVLKACMAVLPLAFDRRNDCKKEAAHGVSNVELPSF